MNGVSLVPTKDEALEAGKLTGGLALGIIAAHAAIKSVSKIDTPVGHGVLLAGGFLGACKVKNPLLKALCAGASVYGGLRLIGNAVAVVSDPATTEGVAGAVAGVLPEGVKSALRRFVPTISGIEEVAGLGDSDDFGNLSLEMAGDETEEVSGLFGTDGIGATVDLLRVV